MYMYSTELIHQKQAKQRMGFDGLGVVRAKLLNWEIGKTQS